MPCDTWDLYIIAHNVDTASNSVFMTIKNPPNLPPNNFKTSKFTSTNDTISLDIIFPDPVNFILILVSKSDKMDDLQFFEDGLRNNEVRLNNLNFSKIVYQDSGLYSVIFEIGNENSTSQNWTNPPLSSATNYSIDVFLINTCNTMTRVKRLQKFIITKGDPNLINDSEILNNGEKQNDGESIDNEGLWALVLLVLIIPSVLYGIW